MKRRNGRGAVTFVMIVVMVGFGRPVEGQEGSSTPTLQAKRDDSGDGSSSRARPNLVLFLVDDLGVQDTSVSFLGPGVADVTNSRRFRTPNVERLAKQGVVFTRAYAASPVCTPTRISILTGQNPARHGTTNWILHPRRGPSAKHPTLLPPKDWNWIGLDKDDVTLPRLLQSAGYRTIHVGKAHLGAKKTAGDDPTNLGFDVNIAGHGAGGPGSYFGEDHYSATKRHRRPSKNEVWDVPGLAKYHGTDVHLTEALTREALREVEVSVKAKRPFFLHLAHYAVHTPIMPDRRFVKRYADRHPTEAAYASLVEGVDKSLGDLLDKLTELDVLADTMIVFFSDNGGLSAHGRGGRRHTHNAPFRSGKGSAHEGGLRVPMIVRLSRSAGGMSTASKLTRPSSRPELESESKLMPESSSSQADSMRLDVPVISDDLFSTFLDAAGVRVPKDHVVDGASVLPFLRPTNPVDPETMPSPSFADRVLGWHYPHQWGAPGPGIHPFSAVRHGRWKLIWFHERQDVELYDLASDPGENHDLATSKPDIVTSMKQTLRDWLRRTGASMSVVRETDTAVTSPR